MSELNTNTAMSVFDTLISDPPLIITPNWVSSLVLALRGVSGDDEYAHVREDQLRALVLEKIATGRCHHPEQCAHEVLQTKNIKFSRWCA